MTPTVLPAPLAHSIAWLSFLVVVFGAAWVSVRVGAWAATHKSRLVAWVSAWWATRKSRLQVEGDKMEQLSFIDAMTKQRTVLGRVIDRNAEWAKNARAVVESLPPGTEGAGEDFRKRILDAGVGEPKHPNAWGALFSNLTRAKVLVTTGELRPMRSAKANARKTPVLRRPGALAVKRALDLPDTSTGEAA